MARLRLLFALLLMAVGTTFGALALSGYYEPNRMMHGQPMTTAPTAAPRPGEMPRAALSHWARLVAVKEGPAASPPTRQKGAKAPPAKPKTVVSGVPPVKRPQQSAAPWPWDFFRN
jgi:hypothetical protein